MAHPEIKETMECLGPLEDPEDQEHPEKTDFLVYLDKKENQPLFL